MYMCVCIDNSIIDALIIYTDTEFPKSWNLHLKISQRKQNKTFSYDVSVLRIYSI